MVYLATIETKVVDIDTRLTFSSNTCDNLKYSSQLPSVLQIFGCYKFCIAPVYGLPLFQCRASRLHISDLITYRV